MKYAGQSPQEIADLFWTDGIVILEGFYEPRQMAQLAQTFDDMVKTDPARAWAAGENYAKLRETRVQIWPGRGIALAQTVMKDPRLEAITKAICGDDCQLPDEIPISVFSTPRTGCQGWHQDSSARERMFFELNRIVFPSSTRPEQGELVYVPGSHLGPDLPPGGNHDPLPGQRSVAPSAGTLVLMHTRCFHRVSENTTDTPRTQCNSRARPKQAPINLTSFPVFRTGKWNFSTGKPE